MRTIIADDHPIILQGTRVLLENSSIEVVGEAGGGDALLQLLQEQPCDVVLTDLAMPSGGPDGPTLLDCIRQAHPGLPVVVLTGTASPSVLATLLHHGVRGVLDKAADFEELPLAVRSVAAGNTYVSQLLRSHLEERDLGRRHRRTSLSPGERDVLDCLRRGLSINMIANERGRSAKTISRQKSDAMRKLGLSGNHELYAFLRAYPNGDTEED